MVWKQMGVNKGYGSIESLRHVFRASKMEIFLERCYMFIICHIYLLISVSWKRPFVLFEKAAGKWKSRPRAILSQNNKTWHSKTALFGQSSHVG